MFDGNHRIRKEINLGSRARRNRARTTTQAKTDLLETARKQREARAEAQRRTNSAAKVQRTYRGHSSRRRLGRELASLAIDGGRLDAAEVLSLRLSDPLLPHWPDDDDDDGDGEGGGNTRTAAAAEGQKKTKKKRQRNNYRKTVGALLEYARQFDPSKVATVAGDGSAGSVGMAAMEGGDVRSGDESLTVVSKSAVEPTAGARWAVASSRIARASLALLLIDCDDLTAESAATLADLVARLCRSSPSVLTKLATVGNGGEGDGGVAPLFLAFRMWFWRVDFDPDGPSSSPSQRFTVDVARTLLRLSSEAVRRSRVGEGEGSPPAEGGGTAAVGVAGGSSVLAAVLLGTRDLRRHPLYADAAADSDAASGDESHAGWWLLLVEALVRCLDGGGKVEGGAGSGTSGSTAGAIVAGRELVVLSNVLDLLWKDHQKSSPSAVDDDERRLRGARVVDAVLRTIRHVLARRPDLAHLAGVAALRGTGAVDEWAAARKSGSSSIASAMSVDGDDDGEDSSSEESTDRDYDEEAAATSASGGGGGGGASGLSSGGGLGQRGHGQGQRRLTRSDLQTTKALDVLVQGENARGRRDALSSASAAADDGGRGEESSLLVSLASAVGGGDLLLRLGGEVARAAASAAVDVGGGAAASRGRWEAYGEVLFVVSRTCSGLRTSSSPLLSALAFAPGPSNVVLDGLWNVASSSPVPQQAQAQRGGSRKPPAATTARGGDDDPSSASHRMMAMTAFCDVFAHRLLAMDDEEFVATYVSEAHSGGGGGLGGAGSDATIRPDGVVTWLGRILHGLYWTDPVVSTDVVSNSGGPTGTSEGDRVVTSTGLVRTRLLLSGTKLYNSLYERWCRMETPFCGEECWWWPKLVSTSMHRARSAGRGGGGGGDGDLVIRVDDDGGSTGVAGMDVEETFYDDDIDDDDSDAEMEDASAGRRRRGRGAGGAGSTMTTQDEENEALAASFRDPKMARVLTACPQAVPFQRRVAIFQSMLDADKYRTQNEMVSLRSLMMNGDLGSSLPGRVQVRVRRDEIYRDSMDQLNALGPRLREKVQVTLVNRHGTEESGIDGGGLFKEFLDDLISEAFDPGKDWALFAVSPLETLFVNTNRSSVGGSSEGLSNAKMLEQYEFLGRVLGKAVYESILVEPQFGLPFLNKLLGKQNTLDDLKKLDPEVYRHLRSIRRMDNVADLGLTFEVTSSVDARGNPVSGGGLRTIPLCPNGGSIPVTKRNAIQYVHLLAHHKLNVEGSPQTRAFLRGFRDLIPAAWVRLFSARELQKLISGDDAVRGIDVDGLRQCMQYAGGYHPSQPIIVWFWEVVREMTPDQQRKLLRFVTSCSRQPLLGFRALNPLPCVQQVRVGDAAGDAKLPTSSTCMNLLKLPNYDSKELLREKLLYSVESGAGFELT